MEKNFNTPDDDVPQGKAKWERRIRFRWELAKRARQIGDADLVEMYEERLNFALEGYIRDHPPDRTSHG
ncbi:hypothetical protein [Streptomyces sp. AK02-04a]|uniref:hypothetical protein n=1 Tax=Streptomyces sp. AK02-04a TaxID=3028649 RepID=UPI0029BDEA1B|nr:hypothetical protein [Streptomyces sp. AK02-04a]MDX3763880.1 hypothetical protein [Streptomyces sp. AK02-04a]